MKIIFNIILLLSSLYTKGEELKYYIDSSSIWKCNYWDSDFYHYDYYHSYVLFIDGDTLINNKNYYKLFRSGYSKYDYFKIDYVKRSYYYQNYAGAISDTVNRIYFIYKDTDLEILLYDFDLTVGDTIKSKIGNNKVVEKIDIVLDNKRKFILPDSNLYIIEGIGGRCCLLKDLVWQFGVIGDFLDCYSQNDSILIKLTNEKDCFKDIIFYQPTDLIQVREDDLFKIYPNPVEDILYIDNSTNSKLLVQIIDLFGRIVMEYECNNRLVELNLDNLNSGVYMIQIPNKQLRSIIIKK